MKTPLLLAAVLLATSACATRMAKIAPPPTDGGATDGANPDGGTPRDGATSDAGIDAVGIDAASYTPPDGTCDPILQDCPHAGDSCYPADPTGQITECGQTGSGTTGALCGPGLPQYYDCAIGYQCGPFTTTIGNQTYDTCTRLCATDADCTDAVHPSCRLYTGQRYGYCG